MSVDYHSLVTTILNEVKKGLGPYVVKTFAEHFGRERNAHLKSLKRALSSEPKYRSMDFENDENVIANIDIAGWLKVMRLRWDPVFKEKLGEDVDSQDINVLNARAYVRELTEGRNKWGHETDKNPISALDVIRIAGTATRMLRAIGAENEAKATHDLLVEFVQANAEAIADGEIENDEKNNRVDLSGMNMSDMDLRGRNLDLAKLRGADLSGSNLERAGFVDLDLFNVNLSRARLFDAVLNGSNLSHARLQMADLNGAEINGVDFSHADLTRADLSDFLPAEYGESLLYEGAFDYMLETRGYTDVNLSHAILREAKIQRRLLEPANLTGADMTGTDFTGSRIADASLAGAILNSAILSKCDILGCDFSGTKMQGVDLSESECVYSNFANADMSGANLESFCIGDVEFVEEESWNNVDLSGANLKDAFLARVSFRNANLTGAKFLDANLSYADLSNSDLKETNFTGANLICTDFTGATFYPFSTILPDGSYWDEDTDMTRFTG